MDERRRAVLKGLGLAAVTGTVAGCTAEPGTDAVTTSGTPGGSTVDGSGGGVEATADVAVAAEWNAMRARLFDAVALGRGGDSGTGAVVATDVSRTFERATSAYGAHAKLESTSETAYEGFESALEKLGSALDADDVEAAAGHASRASTHLSSGQIVLVGSQVARAFDVLVVASRAADARMLADAGSFEGAATVADAARGDFEGSPADDLATEADGGARDRLVDALAGLSSAAGNGNADALGGKAALARSSAVDLATTLVENDQVAGAGHLALLQSRGYDATALAGFGGPSSAFAHAAVLNSYRIRVADVARLVDAGATDRAATVASDVFADFEGSNAHDALEGADHDAYEGFESGLEALQDAAASDDAEAVADAIETVDSNLVTGIEALATDEQAAALEAGFFRARLADAVERFQRGESAAAKAAVQALFERFESNELDLHETIEHTSESLYDRFESDHVSGLIEALGAGDAQAVATHYEGAQSALLTFERKYLRVAVAGAAEADFVLGRAFDAAVATTLGDAARAGTIVESTFGHFERGAAGLHEAIEHADEETYEGFESTLQAVGEADDAYGPARAFAEQAVAAVYAVVGTAGGDYSTAAAGIVGGVFETFEEAAVHDRLAEADQDAYDAFESSLTDLSAALKSGEGTAEATTAFERATLRAQFAVVGALGKAPVDGPGGDESGSSSLSGGPNVVEGVPEDADQVVKIRTVRFDPETITVSVGDTVAFEHVGGEAHTVTADEDELPDGAEYWASGGFDSEQAARDGWEEDRNGAVQSGQTFVHTFDTAGEYPYFCIPHETAGMKGTVVVEA